MNGPFLWALLAALIVGAYLAALNLSLINLSRAALRNRLEHKGRAEQCQWLLDHLDAATLSTALFRTIARAAVVALVLAEAFFIAGTEHISWTIILLSIAVATVLLWVFTTVIGASLAQHVGTGIVASAMPLLRFFTVLCSPLNRAMALFDEAIKRLTGANLRDEEEQAEQQLLQSIEDTQREGTIDDAALEMVEKVLDFGTTDVGEVMTPRTDIEGLERTNEIPVIRDFIIKSGHSRIPIYDESLDRIAGILYVKDLAPYLGEDRKPLEVEHVLRKPLFVPETKPVSELLNDFQTSEVHMAIVVDEYGGTAGLVTMEDVIEEIVGEIHDEHEPEHEELPTLDAIDEHHAEVDGRFNIDDLNSQLGLDLPEDEEYDTIAGFVLAKLGHVPEIGEEFESHNARFRAIAASPTTVERIRIEMLVPSGVNGDMNKAGNGK